MLKYKYINRIVAFFVCVITAGNLYGQLKPQQLDNYEAGNERVLIVTDSSGYYQEVKDSFYCDNGVFTLRVIKLKDRSILHTEIFPGITCETADVLGLLIDYSKDSLSLTNGSAVSLKPYRDITKNNGTPSGAPASGDPKVQQDTTSGFLYYYDGSDWVRIGQTQETWVTQPGHNFVLPAYGYAQGAVGNGVYFPSNANGIGANRDSLHTYFVTEIRGDSLKIQFDGVLVVPGGHGLTSDLYWAQADGTQADTIYTTADTTINDLLSVVLNDSIVLLQNIRPEINFPGTVENNSVLYHTAIVSDESVSLADGASLWFMRIPPHLDGYTVANITYSVAAASTGGDIDAHLRIEGVDLYEAAFTTGDESKLITGGTVVNSNDKVNIFYDSLSGDAPEGMSITIKFVQ